MTWPLPVYYLTHHNEPPFSPCICFGSMESFQEMALSITNHKFCDSRELRVLHFEIIWDTWKPIATYHLVEVVSLFLRLTTSTKQAQPEAMPTIIRWFGKQLCFDGMSWFHGGIRTKRLPMASVIYIHLSIMSSILDPASKLAWDINPDPLGNLIAGTIIVLLLTHCGYATDIHPCTDWIPLKRREDICHSSSCLSSSWSI